MSKHTDGGTERYMPAVVPVRMFPGKVMGRVLLRETGQLAAETVKVRKDHETAYADAITACAVMQRNWDSIAHFKRAG